MNPANSPHSDGEIRRFDPANPHAGGGEIIEFPENYEDMIKKLQEREQESIKKELERNKVETLEELKKIKGLGIVKRFTRAAAEHKKLSDHTVIKESKNLDVLSLRQKLYEEMNAVFQRAMKELPTGDLSTLEKKVIGFRKFKDVTRTQEGPKSGPQPSSGGASPKKD